MIDHISNIVVESADTQRMQETHNLIGRILCELVERMLFEKTRD
jgi:hypothetical protein